jgi:hypothetical protein
MAYEKARRMDTDNPRSAIAALDSQIITKKTGWRDHSTKAWKKVFDGTSCDEKFPDLRETWEETAEIEFVLTSERKDLNKLVNKKNTDKILEETIKDLQMTIFTDGSARDGNRDGGAGVVIIPGNSTIPK